MFGFVVRFFHASLSVHTSVEHWVELRSSIACVGFVSSNPLFGRLHGSYGAKIPLAKKCEMVAAKAVPTTRRIVRPQRDATSRPEN